MPLLVNWVCTPPGSEFCFGGHQTIFRIIKYLEGRGHFNRVYLDDIHCGDFDAQAAFIKARFGFKGPIVRVEEGFEDAHALVATAWPTAYRVFNATCCGERFYLVQDFEPRFHSSGSLSALAENTYRMGFHGITAGSWLTSTLRQAYDMSADFFNFGCDMECYRRGSEDRRGVAFYARPTTSRRGFQLGMLALQLFAHACPEVEIHLFGEKVGATPFKCADHGPLDPAALGRLYNRCFAGLSLSLTNASLVPLEMLAAGCLPVVNDADHTRAVLNNPYVLYASVDPHSLAEKLEAAVNLNNWEAVSRSASESVRYKWEEAGEVIESIFRRVVAASGQADRTRSRKGPTPPVTV